MIPPTLEGALRSLYGSYEQAYRHWDSELRKGGYETPPVFIVVCPNTTVSKLVFEWIAGVDVEPVRRHAGGPARASSPCSPTWTTTVAGWPGRAPSSSTPPSSRRGEAMKDEFKQAVGHEIEQFKLELRHRNPSVDVENLTDEDLLREVMNTVGKPGRLGEGVRCVVSVSMLTEGWDANTVTHILGIRAFNSRLLCEQVVGRALRRRNYTVNEEGRFDPEYAEVYGVPFDFIPSDKVLPGPTPKPAMLHVRALPERDHLRIEFPAPRRLPGGVGRRAVACRRSPRSRTSMWTAPLWPPGSNSPARRARPPSIDLDGFMAERPQKVAYEIAADVVSRFYRGHDDALKPWLFPQMAQIARQWLDGYVTPSAAPRARSAACSPR